MIIKYNYINYNSIKILKHGCCRCRRKTTKLELAWLQFHGCLSEHCCRSSLAMMQKWPICGLRISFLGHDLCAAAFVPAGQVGKGHGLVPASPLLVALLCQLLSLWDRDNWDVLFSTSVWTHRSHLVKPCTIPLQLNNGLSYQLTTGKSSCNFNSTMKINHAYKT